MLPDKCFILKSVMFSLSTEFQAGHQLYLQLLQQSEVLVSTAMLDLVDKIGRRCRISAFARKGSGCGKVIQFMTHDREVVHSNINGFWAKKHFSHMRTFRISKSIEMGSNLLKLCFHLPRVNVATFLNRNIGTFSLVTFLVSVMAPGSFSIAIR